MKVFANNADIWFCLRQIECNFWTLEKSKSEIDPSQYAFKVAVTFKKSGANIIKEILSIKRLF